MRSIFNTTNFVYNQNTVIYSFQNEPVLTPSTQNDGSFKPSKPRIRLKNKNLIFKKKPWQLSQ